MNLADLSTLLWRQRRLLELLLFKLDEQEMILATGRTCWLAHAAHEIEIVLAEIKEVELQRASVLEAVALDLGICHGATLEDVAAAARAPWCGIFADHRAALLLLTRDVGAIADASRAALERGHDDTRLALRALAALEGRVDLVNEAG